MPENQRWVIEEAPRPNFEYGLWHPPLYVYVLALSYKIFGTASWAARLPGVVCFLITLWLLWRLVTHLSPPESRQHVRIFLVSLYLVNPLLIQQGMMLDIDNTVLTLLGVLLLHEFLRMDAKGTPWLQKYAWLTVLMTLSFWAKEFGALYLAVALLVYLGAWRSRG